MMNLDWLLLTVISKVQLQSTRAVKSLCITSSQLVRIQCCSEAGDSRRHIALQHQEGGAL